MPDAEYAAIVQWAMLDELTPHDREEVLGFCTHVEHAPGESVFLQGERGDALYLVESGHALVQVSTRAGDVVTVAVLGPGAVFGEQALVSATDRRIASVVASEPLSLLRLSRANFERLRTTHASVDRFLFAVIAAQTRDVTEQLLEALYVAAETRVLLRLASACTTYAPSDSPGPVRVPLTQDQLASLAGTTRPTVNRVLRRAEEAGALRLGRGKVDVVDLAALRELADAW